MVHGGNHRHHCFAVGKCQNRNLGTGQKFFNDHVVAAFAEHFVFHNGFYGVFGLFEVLGDDNALAERQAVGFNDRREFVFLSDILDNFLGVGKHSVVGRGNVVFLHQVFGKHLAAFNNGGVFVRPEAGNALRFERVHTAEHQRVVRRDNAEVDFVFHGKIGNRRNIFRPDVHASGVFCDAAVAGAGKNFGHIRVFL